MAAKQKSGSKKTARTKRVVTEVAPAVRVMLDTYLNAHNVDSERVSSPLKYTDVINLALDAFLSNKSNPGEEATMKKEKKPEKAKKVKPGKTGKPI